jgi:hypothetical protein
MNVGFVEIDFAVNISIYSQHQGQETLIPRHRLVNDEWRRDLLIMLRARGHCCRCRGNLQRKSDYMGTPNWNAFLYNEDDVVETFVYLNKNPLEDAEFHRRLLNERWVYIIIGHRREGRTHLLVLDLSTDPYERTGLLKTKSIKFVGSGLQSFRIR